MQTIKPIAVIIAAVIVVSSLGLVGAQTQLGPLSPSGPVTDTSPSLADLVPSGTSAPRQVLHVAPGPNASVNVLQAGDIVESIVVSQGSATFRTQGTTRFVLSAEFAGGNAADGALRWRSSRQFEINVVLDNTLEVLNTDNAGNIAVSIFYRPAAE